MQVRQDDPDVLYRHIVDKEQLDTFFINHIQLARAERFARQILPYSQRCNPNLTLHDEKHSIRVIQNINSIADMLIESGTTLSTQEMELLYISGWYHDIGLLLSPDEYSPKNKDKDRHGRKSAEMIREYDLIQNDEQKMNAVCTMVESHNYGVDEISDSFLMGGCRIKMLCSILCLADLCDYNEERAQQIVFEMLKNELDEEEEKHWVANRSLRIKIIPEDRLILVSKIKDVNCDVLLNTFKEYAPKHIKNIPIPSLNIVYNECDDFYE